MKVKSKKRIIIAIHGVGDSSKGEVARGIADTINNTITKEETIRINGEDYIQISSMDDREKILEVNWADLMKPSKKPWPVIKHAGFIILTMMALAEKKFKDRFIKRDNPVLKFFNPSAILRFFSEALLPGTIFFALITSSGKVMSNTNTQKVLVAGLIVVFTYFIFRAMKYSRNYKLGWVWIGLFLVYFSLLFFENGLLNNFLTASLLTRKLVFIITGAIAFIVFLFYLVAFLISKDRKLIAAELSFTYFPFIAYNSIATLITYLSLLFFDKYANTDLFKDWQNQSNAAMPFDLKHAELITTITYSSIGLLPVIGLIIYLTAFKKLPSPTTEAYPMNSQGNFVQRYLYFMLLLIPLLLFCLTVKLVMLMNECGGQNCTHDSMLSIYGTSVLRVLPFLTWLVGPFAVITDVIGDIFFYIHPDIKAKHCIKEPCAKRMKDAIEYARSLQDTEILVLAHSWGSVVACDHLRDNPVQVDLITIGSPVEALCDKFIGSKMQEKSGVRSWLNGYRYDDYIAGPVHIIGVENRMLGKGGHTDYWTDKALINLLN